MTKLKKVQSKKFKKVQISALSTIDFDEIERISDTLESYLLTEGVSLDKKYSEATSYEGKEFISEEHYYNMQVLNQVYALSIVALYIRVEDKVKRIANIIVPGFDKRKSYLFKYVIAQYLTVNINLKSLSWNKQINEIRLINNSIKHGGLDGKPNDELKKLPRWKNRKSLGNLKSDFKRLNGYVPKYLLNLGKVASRKI